MRSQPRSLLVGLFVSMAWGAACDVPEAVAVAQPPAPAVQAPDEAAPGPQAPLDEQAAGPCEGFRQPGCVQTGCPEGQVCRIGQECVPTLCSCDPETGQSICSLDCGGGTCVDASRQCPPSACRLLCTWGRERDDDGCEVCRCQEAPRCACTGDDDCMKVVTGCCPCSTGGTELAIAKDCADRLAQCPVPPEEVPCVAFNRCTKKVAACVAGECRLQNAL